MKLPFSTLTIKTRQLLLLLPRRDMLIALCLWLTVGILIVTFPGLTRAFELGLRDLKIHFNAYYYRHHASNSLLIAIDSETLADAPHKWPWPQDYWAKIVRKLNSEGKPSSLIIDVFFQTPDGAESHELKALAAAIQETGKTGLVALYEEFFTSIGRQLKYVPPHSLLRNSAAFTGLSQQPIDEDGKIRSFLLKDFRISTHHIAWSLRKYLGKTIYNEDFLHKLNRATALINFAASEAGIPQISLKQLLNTPELFEMLEGCDIVIGATAPVLHDFHQTPTGLVTGPEIICNTVSTLETGSFQLLEDSIASRAIYYLIGILLALSVFSDYFLNPYRKLLLIWFSLPLILFWYSLLPLYHPPVTMTWFSYTITAALLFTLYRFIEISQMRDQLLEAEICGGIQKNFFPNENLTDERGITCYGKCIPYKDAGGDFYDFFTLKTGQIFFMLGDVTGHGISAGMITTVAKSIVILESDKQEFSLQELFQKISFTIFSMTRKKRMMSAVAGIIDPENRKITIASAGHLPIVIKTDSSSSEIPLPGLPLGVSRKPRPISTQEIDFPENGKLFVYSDGIIEGLNWNDQMLGYEKFNELVASLPPDQTCEEDADMLLSYLREHTMGRNFEDDVTLLIIDLKKRK